MELYQQIQNFIQNNFQKTVIVVGIILVTLLVSRLLNSLIKRFAKDRGIFQQSSILTTLVRTSVYALGLLVILQTFGIEITPLLTALGVGSLALAFGLQDTVATLFAGFQVLATDRIKIGDYIEVGDGKDLTGKVVDIDWRYTTLQPIGAKTLAVPNKMVAESAITNFSIAKERYVVIKFEVGYDSDLDAVEELLKKLTVKIVRSFETEKDSEKEPVVRFTDFGESGIATKVMISVRKKTNRFKVEHDLIKAIHKEFGKKGIDIPYPTRVVYSKKAPTTTKRKTTSQKKR